MRTACTWALLLLCAGGAAYGFLTGRPTWVSGLNLGITMWFISDLIRDKVARDKEARSMCCIRKAKR